MYFISATKWRHLSKEFKDIRISCFEQGVPFLGIWVIQLQLSTIKIRSVLKLSVANLAKKFIHFIDISRYILFSHLDNMYCVVSIHTF